jgi:hypothetical protein
MCLGSHIPSLVFLRPFFLGNWFFGAIVIGAKVSMAIVNKKWQSTADFRFQRCKHWDGICPAWWSMMKKLC